MRAIHKNVSTFFLICLILSSVHFSKAQVKQYTTANAHSHNDYEQALPFYDAYARHFGSIEADVWAMGETLYVAHNRSEIDSGHTFKKLYLDPLIHRILVNHGQPYENGQSLQLLIDLKSSYTRVLPLLEKKLKPYKKYFDRRNNRHAVRIVISGNMPPPDSLHFYSPVFTFDGRLNTVYPQQDLQRIKLVSANIQQLVSWNEDGDKLSLTEQRKVKKVIDSIHQKGKLIRFWATPNTERAYGKLMNLGVDYIGSDNLSLLECTILHVER